MKRSREMIISQILDVCANGAHKTKIVYQANLNFRTISPYLDLLIRNGLLDSEGDSDGGRLVTYRTTTKGRNLLNDLREIHDELRPDEPITA
jgi:predicted transcriptional regulator